MPQKRKLLKRKLRRMRRVTHEHEPTQTSRTDSLISSMEALVRKIALTPTGGSTVIASPAPAPAPAPIPAPKEPSKEEIMREIANQREIDMLKNQMHYMYDKVNEDIKARNTKGEIMARMEAQGTSIKPKHFNIDENNEIFSVQRTAAKNLHQQKQLEQHEVFDLNATRRRENKIFRETVFDKVKEKLDDIVTSPLRVELGPSTPRVYENRMHTPPVLKESESQQFHTTTPATPKKLSSLFDTPTPKLKGRGVIGTPPKPDKRSEEVFEQEPLSHTVESEEEELSLPKRKAIDVVDEAFEDVANHAAKVKLHQMVERAEQRVEDEEMEKMLALYSRQRDVNNRIVERQNEILNEHSNLSPERRLEKAIFYNQNRIQLHQQMAQLIDDISKKRKAILDVERLMKTTRDKSFAPRAAPRVEANKQMVEEMKKALEQTKRNYANSSDETVNRLKGERVSKMENLKNDINQAMDTDQELQDLIRQRNELEFRIRNSSRKYDLSFDVDPNGARESLQNQRAIVEQYVQRLNDEG